MQHVNRFEPAGRPDQYKTYGIASPVDTHYRDASCQEVECEAYAKGWKTTLDASTAHGQAALKYIATDTRTYTAEVNGDIVTLTYPHGQRCFSAHKVALERPAIFLVRDGDWRGNPLGTRPVSRTPDDWVDDFANHQQAVHDAVEKG